MQDAFADDLEGMDPRSIEQARETLRILAHGYFHDGVGGGVSMDHIVQATLDLMALGFDPEMCRLVGMERLQRRLEGLTTEWEDHREPVKDGIREQRALLFLQLAAKCACDDSEEGPRPYQRLWIKPL